MGDRVKKRIQETVGRTLDRRERYKAVHDLGIHSLTADPHVKALWEQDPVAPMGAEPIGTQQDVIVAPEGPEAGAVPAPEGPMKPPEELGEPGEPSADPDEEKRRALFNTLSELIDLGRIERDEGDIRQYADEHADEVGEMGDVLDDVIEMLVIDSQIYRDPQTFDVESTPGDKSDRGEMKPGVGQQVPTGSTVTTMIASDQTKSKGDPIQEILDGRDVDEVLSERGKKTDEQVSSASYTDLEGLLRDFRAAVDSEDENMIVEMLAGVMDYVKDEEVLQDVESWTQRGSPLEEVVELGEGILDSLVSTYQHELTSYERSPEQRSLVGESVTEQGEAWTYYGVDISGNERFPAGGSGGRVSGVDPEDALTRAYDKTDPFMADELEERGVEEYLPGVWGKRGLDDLELTLVTKGKKPASKMRDLVRKVWEGGEEEVGDEKPPEEERVDWEKFVLKRDPPTFTFPAGVAVAAGEGGQEFWDELSDRIVSALQRDPAVSKVRIVGRPGWTMNIQMELKDARYLSEETLHRLWQITLEATDGQASESVTEQMEITRASAAVELNFGKKEEAMSAKGALLQYKGVDSVQETKEGGLVVFTTDTDPDEARKRIETIMANARIPMEGMGVEVYRPVLEFGPASSVMRGRAVPPVSHSYQGPDLMPTPLPMGHGQSGADLEAEGEYPKYFLTRGPEDTEWQKVRVGSAEHERFFREKSEEAGIEFKEVQKQEEEGGGEQEEPVPPTEPGEDEKYLKPFYEPDGEEEPMIAGEGLVWRMDVPEDPEEFERLAEVLNKAKDSGLIVSWTRMGGPEEEPELPPGVPFDGTGDVLDLRDADVDVAVPTIEAEKKEDYEDDNPPVNDLEPGDAFGDEMPPVDELPPEEEPEEEYIAVEFAPETEPDERLHFPEWVSAETEDPETGEGAIMVGGWAAADEEEPTEEPPPEDEIDLEEPVLGEAARLTGLSSEGFYFEITCDTKREAVRLREVVDQEPSVSKVRLGNRTVTGLMDTADEKRAEDLAYKMAARAGLELTEAVKLTDLEEPVEEPLPEGAHVKTLHQQGIYFEVRLDTMQEAEKYLAAAQKTKGVDEARLDRGDQVVVGELSTGNESDAKHLLGWIALEADLEILEQTGTEYQRWQELQKAHRHAIKHAGKAEPRVRVKPSLWKAAAKKPGAPELPADVQKLVTDYRAAMASGDADLAQRIKGELEFELQGLGVDPKTVLGEDVGPVRNTYSTRRAKAEKIVSELMKYSGTTSVKGPKSVRDAVALYWGPRADWELRPEGPYSFDSGRQETWKDEVEFLVSEVDDHTINEVLSLLAEGPGASPSDFPEGSRGQDGLEEQRGEWPGVTPRVDAVVVRRGASPEEVLLKVEGPKVIVRSGETWNVDPASYVVHVAGGWLKDRGQEAGVRRVNPDTVQVTVAKEKDLPEVLKTIHEALDNLYADVSGYGITEPLQRPAGLVRRAFRRLTPFKFEGAEDA